VPSVVGEQQEERGDDGIVPLVLSGIGATVLPAALATAAAERGATVAELDPPLRRRIGLVHRPGTLSPAARVFRQLATGGESATDDFAQARPS
jgi:LysR substrate binding domain